MNVIKIIVMCFLLFLTEFNAQSLEEGLNFATNYITSARYSELKKICEDPELIDSIYISALKFYNYNISETLLALAFATLPFDNMPIRLPIVQIKFQINLPNGTPQLREAKNDLLPGKLFFDSPNTKFADKDKVAHFFGSAFLAHSFRFFNITKFMGILVEIFEKSFEVQGRIDNRDLIADNLGELFGDSLKKNKSLLPSQAMSVYIALFTKY